jgi:hypothetical protein
MKAEQGELIVYGWSPAVGGEIPSRCGIWRIEGISQVELARAAMQWIQIMAVPGHQISLTPTDFHKPLME